MHPDTPRRVVPIHAEPAPSSGGFAAPPWIGFGTHESVVDGRRRRVYQLTPTGEQALGERVGEWEQFARSVARTLAAGAVLVLGWIAAIGLLATASAVHGLGQDGPTPGAPLLLVVGAMAAGVVSLLAAAAVWSWSSAVASSDATWRRAMAAFAAASAFGLVGLGVHVGKHQAAALAHFASSARCFA